ncbi:MAG: 30S ribosomal protein S20 [Candidatus Coatesbacteria bacterium]|nr:30S ribosomal protein S20 [Candidatus Coatesbacteria bacterium]
MPKHKSVMKRLRQSKDRRLRNRTRKSHMRAAVKKLTAAISSKQGPDKEEVIRLHGEAVSEIAKTSSKGTIHANTASRKISRVTMAVNKALGPELLAGQPPMPKPEPAPVKEPKPVEEPVVVAAAEVMETPVPEDETEELEDSEEQSDEQDELEADSDDDSEEDPKGEDFESEPDDSDEDK